MGSSMTTTKHRSVLDAASTSVHVPAVTRDRGSAALTSMLAKSGAGQVTAFAELYDASAARVYGLALRIVRNPAQAEEVAQESYVEIWRTSNRFDPRRGSAISWILMITHAAAVDRVRSAQASTRREDTYERQVQPIAAALADPTHDLACATFDSKRVRDALAGLSSVQREALVLAYFVGCTQAEIAGRLGVPLGTIKTRIRDGLIRLRVLLAER